MLMQTENKRSVVITHFCNISPTFLDGHRHNMISFLVS